LSATDLKENLIRYAGSLGFERVGVTRAQRLEKEEAHLKRWIAEGRAGEMDYLEREPERRARPAELLAGAKSVIALAMNYSEPSPFPLPKGRGPSFAFSLQGEGGRRPDEGEGRVARYTQGRDYHKTIRKRLDSFVRYLEALAPGAECRTFVDTGPLLERAVAQQAGIGFIGKNTMLITKGLGSWVFLASVITTLDLPADSPDERSCGECRLCIDACPTQAITEPYRLDARLCIAYLTIEQDGPIPETLREKTGPWAFGCDICQEVCPHNALSFRRKPESISSWTPASAGVTAGLAEILSIRTEDEFQKLFGGTAITRSGREGLIRNACVAAANLGRTDLLPNLTRLTSDPSALVREHAAWAVERLEVLLRVGRTHEDRPQDLPHGVR
jgi:epoxyqueuosine reductase